MMRSENAAASRPNRPIHWALALLALAALPAGAGPPRSAPDTADATVGELETAPARAPKKHRRRQGRPVKLGTSGGNVNDFSFDQQSVSCCGGTLGALLEKNGRTFVLSNNHVLARLNQADAGEDVSQPGLNDNRCDAPERNFIGTLSGFKKLKLNGKNKVDAAIAEVDPDQVSPDGAIIDLGIPGNTVGQAVTGHAVVKSGRTTGLTFGEVTDTNVSGFVQFPEECSDDAEILRIRFVKTFLVASTGNKDFSAGGDSGSVIYEDVAECPRAIGLLFAGNELFTAANPMNLVIKAARKMSPRGPAKLVGCDPAASAAAARLALDSDGRRAAARIARAERLAQRAQGRSENDVLSLPGVVAMGVGRSTADRDAVVLRVHVEDEQSEIAAIPKSLEGVPVEVVVSGPLRALHCPVEGISGDPLGGLATTDPR